MRQTIKTMLVDDHDLVRAGIKEMLDKRPEIKVVSEVSTGEEAIKAAREVLPDVILMDIKMPGMSGLEATRKLLRIDPTFKILIVTMCIDDLVSTRLLQAGAIGYLTKGTNPDEMTQAIIEVAAGRRYLSPDIAQRIALNHLQNKDESPFDDLSNREWEIMEMVVNGEGVKAIADKLFLSSKTVNSYRYRIFNKVGVKSDVALTLLAFRYGVLKLEG